MQHHVYYCTMQKGMETRGSVPPAALVANPIDCDFWSSRRLQAVVEQEELRIKANGGTSTVNLMSNVVEFDRQSRAPPSLAL